MNDLFGEVGPSLPMLPWGVGGQPSQNPMMQQQVAQQVAALRNQMQQQEQMRYGMPGQQDPRVGAMMQELESRLGGGPQWRDTTGLGGRMSRLPMPQEQQAPQGPQQDPGLLLKALQLAAGNSGNYAGGQPQLRDMDAIDARSLGQRGFPGASQGRQVIDRNSSIPLSEEPWFDEYVAAGQAGADNMPMIKGGAGTDSPEILARRAAHREARLQNERAGLLPMEERRANVRTNAINKTAARHGRMGIPDNAPQYDLLRRLQAMEGSGDPSSPAGFRLRLAAMGPQGAMGAMQGQQELAIQESRNAAEAQKSRGNAIVVAINSGLVPPDQIPFYLAEYERIMSGGGSASMSMPMQMPPTAAPKTTFLPDRPVNQQPMSAWPQGGAAPTTLTDILNTFGGMEQTEIQGAMAKSFPWNLLPKGPRNSEMQPIEYGY